MRLTDAQIQRRGLSRDVCIPDPEGFFGQLGKRVERLCVAPETGSATGPSKAAFLSTRVHHRLVVLEAPLCAALLMQGGWKGPCGPCPMRFWWGEADRKAHSYIVSGLVTLFIY